MLYVSWVCLAFLDTLKWESVYQFHCMFLKVYETILYHLNLLVKYLMPMLTCKVPYETLLDWTHNFQIPMSKISLLLSDCKCNFLLYGCPNLFNFPQLFMCIHHSGTYMNLLYLFTFFWTLEILCGPWSVHRKNAGNCDTRGKSHSLRNLPFKKW